MEQNKKKKSREAARQRRGQQNDEFGELAAQLPLPSNVKEKLDRLCVMRLSNSFIKIKHVLNQLNENDQNGFENEVTDDFISNIQDALGGFVFVLAEDGQCLYISQNISENLGLQQLDVTGHSIYKYVHPCDQENLAKQLGGQVPLEDMEIFDGLFCADSASSIQNPKPAVSSEFEKSPHRSFFLRMKSTLTSRGKSVNINASIYRVVHCTGTMQTYRTKLGSSDGAMTRCLLAVGMPLLSTASFEVPMDRQTFITKHTLDMKIIEMEDLAGNIVGYKPQSMLGTSWYIYSHICDTAVLRSCHDTVLKKGQALSGYYRIMVKTGGWIWMQTKSNMVYSSTTGLPQQIICIHYVISGLELEEQVLSTEQLTAVASKNFRKRSMKEEKPVVSAAKKDMLEYFQPVIKQNYVPPITKDITEEFNINDDLLQDIDDSDMPGLEFLDVTEDLHDFAGFSSRSPFIPPPFIDSELSISNIEADLSSVIEESELANRVPYIPPPCIDKIVSFDDLDDLDDFDIGESQLNGSPMNSTTLINSAELFNQFYNLEEAHAKIPMRLLAKHCPQEKNQTFLGLIPG